MASKMDRGILEMALIGYEAEMARITARIAEIRNELDGTNSAQLSADGASAASGSKRTLSAAARKRIAAAQRKRWADYKLNKTEAKPKRHLSPAGRKAIVAALKRRWAAKRKAEA